MKPKKQRINYFTFGQNHFHPTTGEAMKDYWIEVIGGGSEAREKIVSIFGAKWSMHYNEDDFSSEYFPKGCYQKIQL